MINSNIRIFFKDRCQFQSIFPVNELVIFNFVNMVEEIVKFFDGLVLLYDARDAISNGLEEMVENGVIQV